MEFTEEKIGELGQLYCGDCLDAMKSMPDNSVTGICTDPPYGLEFMGKEFDKLGDSKSMQQWHYEWAKEALRVAKPGAFMFVFGGTRTSHRLACGIEDAGWVLRDTMMWLYGSGFPKSHNFTAWNEDTKGLTPPYIQVLRDRGFDCYGTALKPAYEPILVCMKPIDGTFAENALKWGVAGINVDAGRIESSGDHKRPFQPTNNERSIYGKQAAFQPTNAQGRWPSNLILQHHPDCVKIGVKKVKTDGHWTSPTNGGLYELGIKNNGHNKTDGNEIIEEYRCHPECPIHLLNQQAGVKKSGTNCTRTKEGFFLEHGGMGKAGDKQITYGDEGYVSRYFLNLPPDTNRFFYSAKASRSERSKGCENLYWKQNPQILISKEEWDKLPEKERSFGNIHSTVKSLSLIKYLCSLLKMPQNTLILDLFTGSGTLGVACEQLKIPYILIEKEPEYCEIIRSRVGAANQPDKPTKRKPIVKPTNTLFDWNEINIETE